MYLLNYLSTFCKILDNNRKADRKKKKKGHSESPKTENSINFYNNFITFSPFISRKSLVMFPMGGWRITFTTRSMKIVLRKMNT